MINRVSPALIGCRSDGFGLMTFPTVRRRTSNVVTAINRIESASSQPPSIDWNTQKRVAG